MLWRVLFRLKAGFKYTPEAGRLLRGLARRFASGSILQATLMLPQMIRRWLERRR